MIFEIFLRMLGVLPTMSGKTGKRETAWLVFVVMLGLTIYSISKGPETITAMQPMLTWLWPSSLGLLAYVYKLEFSKQNSPSG